jgi:RimJ/RimL family protein N-acetyltransferase
VRAQAARDLRWVEERTGCVLTRNARGVEVVDAGGRVVGMVAFDAWTPASAQAHMAVEFAAAWRSLLPAAFEYVFNEAGRDVLLGVIASSNARALKFTERVGFREQHRIRDGWAKDEDLVLLELRKAHCRYLRREQIR